KHRRADAGHFDDGLVRVGWTHSPTNGIILRRAFRGDGCWLDQEIEDQQLCRNGYGSERESAGANRPHGNGIDSRFSEVPSRRKTSASLSFKRSSCSMPFHAAMVS